MDFSNKLSDLKQQHLYRSRKVVVVQDTQIVIDGKSLINFCSNDYLSLANHPQVKKRSNKGLMNMAQALDRHIW